MGCDGGCVNGGGQPHVSASARIGTDIRLERAKALYSEDASLDIRKSHKNPSITRLYEEFLGEPNSHIAHEVLHTHYKARKKYNKEK
jgi:iron only hydrogenase large subunit-like protein